MVRDIRNKTHGPGQRPLREQLVRDPFKLANEKIRFLLALNCGMALFHIRLSRSERQKANPVVAAAIANWGLGWGLVYNKAVVCLLLLLLFSLRPTPPFFPHPPPT